MTEQKLGDFYKEVGQKIKEARRNRDLTQTDFAKLLNLSRASVANIELGRQRPSMHLLLTISNETDIEVSDFFPEVHNEKSDLTSFHDTISEFSKGNTKTLNKLSGFISNNIK